jgi:hypothetical protein
MSPSLEPFFTLQNIVAGMLDAAREANWDLFVELQGKHQQLAARLPVIDWHKFSQDEQKELIDCLQSTRAMLNETVPLAENWRNELAGMLSSIHNSNKLDKAYGA